MAYRFAEHVLDLRTGTLVRTGEPNRTIHLRPKTFELLRVLAQRAGCVVTKDELLAAVWAEAHLSDDTLAQAISELRRALGDSAREPRFIETVHRRGYRFICPVQKLAYASRSEDPEATLPVPEDEPQPPRGRLSVAGDRPAHSSPARRLLAGGWLAAAAAAVLVGWFGLRTLAPVQPAAAEVSLATSPSSGDERPKVAFLDLAVPADPELAWLSTAIPELLRDRIRRGGEIYVYSADRLTGMQRDLSLSPSLTATDVASVRNYLDADAVVSGEILPPALTAAGDQPSLVLRVVDAATGAELLQLERSLSLEDLSWESASWARTIASRFPSADAGQVPLRARGNVTTDHLRAYFEALEILPSDPRRALDRLDTGGHVAAPRMLEARARAWQALGETEQALRAARRARNSSRRPGAAIRYLCFVDRPLEALEALSGLERREGPQDPELWLETLRCLADAGLGSTILATIDQRREGLSGSWVASELDLLEAHAAALVGDVSRQAAAARRAVRAGEPRGHRTTVQAARALEREARKGLDLAA